MRGQERSCNDDGGGNPGRELQRRCERFAGAGRQRGTEIAGQPLRDCQRSPERIAGDLPCFGRLIGIGVVLLMKFGRSWIRGTETWSDFTTWLATYYA
jgi:hypothetical protein